MSADLTAIRAGVPLFVEKHSRARVAEERVREAVQFVLNNVRALSWGSKVVKTPDGRQYNMPAVVKLELTSELYRRYTQTVSDPLKKSIFYTLWLALTKGTLTSRTACDYISEGDCLLSAALNCRDFLASLFPARPGSPRTQL